MTDDIQMVRLALKRGFITEPQLNEARREAASLANRGIDRNLCFILQDLGHLSEEHLSRLRNETSSARITALEIDGYLVRERIGRGGMGDVFLAVDPSGADEVAAKLLPVNMLGDPEFLARFEREVQVLSKMRHPHITAYRGAGDLEGRPYLLMEYVRGESLKHRILDAGPMDEDAVLLLLHQMCQALAYASDEIGVLHRDVKPANIILGGPRPGSREAFCAKLCDFGLAKTGLAAGMEESGTLTKTGMAVGTPHYMSPEIATCADDIDCRADIYSLGATAYFALCGKTMYHGKNSGVIMYKHATSRFTADDVVAPTASRGLRHLLVDMLARDREHRLADWQSVLERVTALRQNEESGAGSLSVSQQRQRRFGLGVMVLVGSVLVVLAVGAALMMSGARATVRVTPETLPGAWPKVEALLLAEAGPDPVHLVLEPGIYARHWQLTPQHNGLRIRGEGAGVVLTGADTASAVFDLAAHAQHIELHQVAIETTATAAHIGKGGRMTWRAVQVSKAQHIAIGVDAGLTVYGSRLLCADDGFQFQDGSLALHGSEVQTGAGVVSSRGTDVMITSSVLQADGKAPSLVDVRSGSVEMTGVRIEGSGHVVGIEIAECEPLILHDVLVSGVGTGVRSFLLQALDVRRLHVEAEQTGWEWTGDWSTAFQWQDVTLRAPNPLAGENVRGLQVAGQPPAWDRYHDLPAGVR